MAVTSYNPEIIEKAPSLISEVEEIGSSSRVGVVNTVEVADFTGSAKFSEHVNNMAEQQVQFEKSTAELVEISNNWVKWYEKLNEGLN